MSEEKTSKGSGGKSGGSTGGNVGRKKGIKFGPPGSWIQTNFSKDTIGNVLHQGEDLWVKVPGARSYITVVLKTLPDNKVIQIDQSHPGDEDGNIETTRLEMRTREGPMPTGEYSVTTTADVGTGDAQSIVDKFFII